MGKTEHTYPFRWRLQLYKSPPKMRPDEYSIPDEEIARCEELIMDKAKKRLQMER